MIDTWRKTKLGDISIVRSGSTPPRAYQERYYTDNGIPWVKTMDLNNGIILHTDESITDEAIRETSCQLLPKDTVLVAMYGGFNQIGRTGLLGIDAATNQAISSIQLDHTVASPKFVLYWLNARVDDWKRIAASSRKDPNITREDVCNFQILLPSIAEQRRIAEILSTWDRAIDLTAQLIAAKQQYKRGLMQQLLTGKRRFPTFQQKQWSDASFGQIFYTRSVKNAGSQIKNPITVGKYAIRPQNEHFNRIVASDNLENYNIIERGDFVYDPMSAYYGAFGRYELDEAGIVSPVYRVLHINPAYDSDFMKHFIKSHYIAYQLSSNSSQGNREGKRRTIQTEAFDSISFKIPDIDEQRAIAEVLNACDQELSLLNHKLDLLKKQKQGLMQQLLTGKVRVKT